MSRPVRFSPSTIRQARALVSTATSVDELRAAQAVLLAVDHRLSRAQIAALLGVAAATVGRLRQHARKPAAQKKTGRRGRWGGRRRCLLTWEAEKAFLEPWAHQAQTAGMLIVGPLQAALAQRLGRQIRRDGGDVQRLRRQTAFDRLRCRLFHETNPPWLLKGGYSRE